MTWDEPEDDLTEVIEAIWSLNGEPFEVVQEGFHRLDLHTIHHEEESRARRRPETIRRGAGREPPRDRGVSAQFAPFEMGRSRRPMRRPVAVGTIHAQTCQSW